MAEVVLFHHALGLTEGCLALAEDVRAAGHAVVRSRICIRATGTCFTDRSLPDQHDAAASALVLERALDFLRRV